MFPVLFIRFALYLLIKKAPENSGAFYDLSFFKLCKACSVAVFIFFSAAARTRIISADLGIHADRLWLRLLLSILLLYHILIPAFHQAFLFGLGLLLGEAGLRGR